ncbi:MAG TPA: PAS domain S-box protein [Candidatus Acidoferrum sp.]|nr:PAS domain S-box protein [Candidatus Acidoferrum sp.]
MSSLRILVVDDQEPIRRGLRTLLESRSDWSICGEAKDGAEAVAKAKELRPDVILMDLSMPRMNGLDATRIIRREVPESKVVIVSQNDPTVVRRQARDLDAAAYVAKADLSQALLPTIESLVDGRNAAVDFVERPKSERGLTSHKQLISEPLSPMPRQENLNVPNRDPDEPATATRLPSAAILNLGSPTALIELLPMAAYAVRAPDGVIAWFNSRATQLWGRAPEIGDTDERFCGAHKLFYPDGTYMAHCDTPVALVLNTGASVHDQEVVVERPDGIRVSVSVHIDPIRDENGSVVGAVNFFQDITDRKRSERAMGLLAAIVDSSDDAVVSKNLDGIITSWNTGAERVFGHTAEEAIGRHIFFIIPADRRDEEALILERVRRGEQVEHFDTVRVRKDGTLIDISLTISPVKDAAGRIIGASKVARDIAPRKRSEQVLAERARLLDLSNDAILVRDEADRVTYWNKGASMLYGYSREEAMSRVTHELLQTKFPEPLEQINEQLHRDGEWNGELIHKRKDGGRIVVISRWVLDRGERGNQKRVLETNHEITQRKQSEEALRESENRLRALADSLEAQVRIRTEVVLKQSERLRELSHHLMQIQDEERRHIARELHDSAGQTLTALGMNLARVIQHSKNASPELANIAEEAQQLVRELSKEIRTTSYLLHPPLLDESGLSEALGWYVEGLNERGGLEITQSIPEDFGRLSREMELRIFRIVQECLTNVHRHSGSKSAAIRLKRTDQTVFLEIEDNGCGISPERLAEIQSHGAGVGVRGMRERVLQCGGDMQIESEGRGTKISISFPFARNSAVESGDSVQGSRAAV